MIPGLKSSQVEELPARTIKWLAALVLLAQLPHYLHLPWWVSLFGAVVVFGRSFLQPAAPGLNQHSNIQPLIIRIMFSAPVLTAVAACAAVGVRLHYGYFLGRDPCVAFLFLLVAFKFAETRNSKDATLLICLSGFLLLTQYFYAQTILTALISLPAVLTTGACLMILQNPRLTLHFGESIRRTAKLLIQGAPIAAALFILFPRLPGPLWSLPNDSVAQTGLSDTMQPGSISSLSMSGEVAFRVEFEGPPPPPQQRYWRGPVLSTFDGQQWSIQNQGSNPASIPSHSDKTIAYTVTLEPHHRNRLFALDLPVSLPVNSSNSATGNIPLARLTNDLQLKTNKPVTTAIRYRQLSTPGLAYADQSPHLIANTQLAAVNIDTERFARKLRQKHRSDAAFAEAVLQWFNEEPFHYTLQPDLLGARPVDEFLFSSRKGFCEHFASAFVVLLRSASIPARVVTGYLGGEMNGDYMIVRQSDAHAWAEAWINNAWVRFDPTAAVAPERVEGLSAALPDSRAVPTMARMDGYWMKQVQLGWDALNHNWKSSIIDFNKESQKSLWQSLGLSAPKPWQLTLILLLISTIWCLLMLRIRPRRRALPEEHRLWETYCKKMSKAGFPKHLSEGPVDYAQRCENRWPEHAPTFAAINQNLLELRFGNPAPSDRLKLVDQVRKALKQLPSGYRLQQSG